MSKWIDRGQQRPRQERSIEQVLESEERLFAQVQHVRDLCNRGSAIGELFVRNALAIPEVLCALDGDSDA